MHLPPASVHYVGFGSVVLAAAAMIGTVAVSSHVPADDAGTWMRCPNGDPEPGTVDARCVAEGHYVHKGEVLADFTTPAEQEAVRRTQGELDIAVANWLFDDGAETAFEVLLATRSAVTAILQRDRMIIRADSDGYVGRLRAVRPLSYAGVPALILVLGDR